MFRLFGGRNIKRAVSKVLAERIADAQAEFDARAARIAETRKQEVLEAKAREASEKEKAARELADSVLGR